MPPPSLTWLPIASAPTWSLPLRPRPLAEKNPCYLGHVPVNTTHAEYDANLAAWTRARRVMAGEDAIKAAGEVFLPRLELQTDAEYAA